MCEITSNQEFSSTDILKVSYVGTAKAIRVSKLSYSYTTSGGSSDPSITLGSSSIEATEAGADGTISVTYNNITDVVAEVQFFASDGTTPATYDWVTAEINSSNNVEYLVEANTGSARTAYMKVYALDDESNDVYSALITISQEAKSVAAPAFSLNTGRYFTGTTFTLTSKGNTIYYTTDNSTPTNLSTEYTGPVAIISGAKTYKAIAYDTYGNSSTVVSRTFTGIAPANLPFSFDDGKSKIEATAGLIQSGLDSDYGSSPKLKFNSTGDYVILKIDENPGTLSFDIVGNSYSGSSVFKVQTSANGVDYTDLDSYTTLGSTTSKEYNSLGESVRYIRWIYANKDNGNVGLGNISLDNKLHISLSSYQWGTLVANVPLDFEGSTVKAYIVTGHSGAALTKTQMTGTVPANTPLLINAPMDSYEIPVASSSSTDVSENKLVAGTGTAISKEAGKTKYVLSVDGGIAAFKLIDTNSATVPKDKAYLLFNESITLAPSVIRIVDEENNATNIDAIDATEEAVKFIENGKLYILRDGVVYDALGRMVR